MRYPRFLHLAALVLVASALHLASAEWEQLGPNSFVAGIPTDQFEFFAAPDVAGRQRQENWCWAATIQMVLNFHGLFVTQEQIVERIFGHHVDAPAGESEILTALSGWAWDARGSYSTIHASSYVASGSHLIHDLAYRWPLIVGLTGDPIGHAYVLTAVYYSVGEYNQPIFDKVVLRDPWPHSPSRQEMSWQEFTSKLMLAVRVYVERH